MTIHYSTTPEAQTAGHIKLLAVFHFVLAGLTALFACFPIIHIVLGILMVNGKFQSMMPTPPPGSPAPPNFPNEVGYLFIIAGSIFVLFGWAVAILMLIAGLKLQKFRARMFCIVIAAIECLFFPFGTILGVFTLIILMKDSAKPLFGEGSLPPPIPPAYG